VGLLKNLRILAGESILTRMLELERRQELLEDYTDQKLDSMRQYSARVNKRDRDQAERVARPRTHDREVVNGVAAPQPEGSRLARLLARRARRSGNMALQ